MNSKLAWKNQSFSIISKISTRACIVLVTVASLSACSTNKSPDVSSNKVPDKNKVIDAELVSAKNGDGDAIAGKNPVGEDRSYLNLSLSRKRSTSRKKDQLNANYHFNKAEEFRESKKYESAIVEYKRAIRSYPADGAFYKNLGGTFALIGKLDDAEAVLKKGTQVNPKDWLMWNNLAVVKQNLGKNKECMAAIKKSLALKPPKYAQENMELTLKQLESSTN